MVIHSSYLLLWNNTTREYRMFIEIICCCRTTLFLYRINRKEHLHIEFDWVIWTVRTMNNILKREREIDEYEDVLLLCVYININIFGPRTTASYIRKIGWTRRTSGLYVLSGYQTDHIFFSICSAVCWLYSNIQNYIFFLNIILQQNLTIIRLALHLNKLID